MQVSAFACAEALDFRPDVDLVAAAEPALLDGLACGFVAAVAAEAEFLFACAGNHVLPVYRNRAVCALGRLLDRLKVDTDFRDRILDTA